MLKNSIAAFKPAITTITKDKVNLILALIPIITGIIIYWFVGKWMFTSAMSYGQNFINQYLSDGMASTIINYVIMTVLTIMMYFVVNWTFVLLVSLVASPFNDIMSGRIEKQLRDEPLPSMSESFSQMLSRLIKTLINEGKKVLFISALTVLSLLFGYIPILTPVSIFIAFLLLAIQFVDYSWARHDLSVKGCISDIRKNIVGYSLGGGVFFTLVAIPVVNLIVPPLATSYFTIVWVKNNEDLNQITR